MWFATDIVSCCVWMKSCLQLLIISWLQRAFIAFFLHLPSESRWLSNIPNSTSNLHTWGTFSQTTMYNPQMQNANPVGLRFSVCVHPFSLCHLTAFWAPEIQHFLSKVWQTTKTILSLQLYSLVGAPVSDTRGMLEVTESEHDHWQRTCPPGSLAWESSCLCWMGWQDPGQVLTSNQMACVFSGPRSSVDPVFMIAERQNKSGLDNMLNDSSFHSLNLFAWNIWGIVCPK